MSWVSPTGHSDPDTAWNNETNIYDEDIGTYADTNVNASQWGSFIELTISEITSDKIRYYIEIIDGRITEIDIDVYRDGGWVDVYEGSITTGSWQEKTFTEGSVTKARVRFYNSHGYQSASAILYEFDFWEIVTVVAFQSGSIIPTLLNALGIRTTKLPKPQLFKSRFPKFKPRLVI